MVLDVNKQFHAANRFVCEFVDNSTISEEDRTILMNEWKIASKKLKIIMQKNTTKRPTRIMSPYLFFCADERPKIQAANPNLNIKECTCMLGKAWQEFKKNPDQERMERYKRQYDADQKRYKEEMDNLNQEPVTTEPKTAYLRYCARQRELTPKISMKELSIGWIAVKNNPVELATYETAA